MVNRFIAVVVVIPLAIILVALAVANRGMSAFTFDPFNPGNPALTFNTPLFVLLFAAAAIGIVIGSFVTWLRQGRYRRIARQRLIEAEAAKASAARAQRTTPQAAPALPRP